MSEVTPIVTLDIVLTICFTFISLVLGIIMILKYFKYKNRVLLFVGSTWCLITSPFWSDIISFLAILFFGTPLSDFFYFLFSLGFIPIAHVTWMGRNYFIFL